MAYTNEQRRTALDTFSVSRSALPRQQDGSVDDAERWARIEIQLMQALCRDVDLLWYFVFLASNYARQRMAAYVVLLEAVLACWEGHLYAASSRPPVETGAIAQLARLKESARADGRIDGDVPSVEQISRTVTALRAHAAQNLARDACAGTSLRLRAPEARTTLSDLHDKVLAAGQKASDAAARVRSSTPAYDAETIRREAARPVIEAAEVPSPSPDEASVRLLAALSTVSALDRYSQAYTPEASSFAAPWAETVRALGTLSVPNANAYFLVPESAAHIRDGMAAIATVAASLASLSQDTVRRLARVGVVIPTTTPATTYLDQYAPAFSTSTKQTGRALLDACRTQKFDLAEESLLTAQILPITTRSLEGVRRTEALQALAQGVE